MSDYCTLSRLVLFTLLAALSLPGRAQAPADGGLDPYVAHVLELQALAPGELGIPAFGNAYHTLMSTNLQDVPPHRETMRQIVREGWNEEHQEVARLLTRHGAMLQTLKDAAYAQPIDWPTFELEPGTPVPNFLELQSAAYLMASGALYHQSRGDLAQAAEWAVATVRFGEFFTDDDLPLISNLIGVAIVTIGARACALIVADVRLTPTHAGIIAKELHDVDSRIATVSLAKIVKRDMLSMVIFITTNLPDLSNGVPPGSVERHLQETAERYAVAVTADRAAGVGPADYEAALDKGIAAIDKPIWERRGDPVDVREWANGLETEMLKAMDVPSIFQMQTRFAAARALVLVVSAASAERAGTGPTVATINDPFTGKPLRRNGNVIFSVGPDFITQNGEYEYDPSPDATGTGDIVARLP